MKVDIIGGGIAGLSLGIYLQKNNIETTIYEQHSVCGGLCTGWSRGEYSFNGCMHWLLGSNEGISFNTFWKELIDLSKIEFVHFEERVQIELPIADSNGNRIFHFINDIDKFENYLIDIAPEDTKAIKTWTSQVRHIMPLLDYLPPVFNDEPWYRSLFSNIRLIKLTPMTLFMHKWSKITNIEFAKRFKNPFLKMAIEQLYEKEMRMPVLFFVQAYAAKHVAGYPIGGSLNFAQQLEKEYHNRGGKIIVNAKIDSINVSHNKAIGLNLSNGTTTKADFVASTADWHWTVFDALGGKYVSKQQLKLQKPLKEQIFYSFCILYLGVDKTLDNMTHFMRFPTEPIVSPDGTQYERLEMHIYNYDKTLAPDGKTTLAIYFQTREGEFWINCRKNNIEKYRAIKEEFTQQILNRIEQKFPKLIVPFVEVKSLTTPATYNRYTSNYNGSSQGWTPMNNVASPFAVTPTLRGLNNFVMAGHWMNAGGGIPIALHSARKAAWHICNKLGKHFVTSTK